MMQTREGDPSPSTADAPGSRPAVGLRPKDAAALILIDRLGPSLKALLGRRGSGHVFMPDVYVFPGGRRDPRDHALPYGVDLHPLVMEKLQADPPRALSASRARALALAALRELAEETGIIPLGGLEKVDLSGLRYVARAVTPPGNVRRYDTRFFAAFADETLFDLTQMHDTAELQDLQWLDIGAVSSLKLPRITEMVMQDVKNAIQLDPSFSFGAPVPFYFMRHGRSVRSRL